MDMYTSVCEFKGSVDLQHCINLKMQVYIFLCIYFVMSADLLQLNFLVFLFSLNQRI